MVHIHVLHDMRHNEHVCGINVRIDAAISAAFIAAIPAAMWHNMCLIAADRWANMRL